MKQTAEQLNLRADERVYTKAPYIQIQEVWEEFLKNRGNGFRKRVNKNERRLLGKGDIDIVLVNDFSCEDHRIGNILETAKRIEQQSWKFKQGSPRILTNTSSQKFYHDFLQSFSEKGWMDSWFALLDGVPIAYAFNIHYNGKIFAYNAAYDDRYKEYSVGSLLHIKRIKNAFERSLKEYDFLRGEESYKKFWTDDYRELYQVVLFPKTIWSYLAYWACFKARWLLAKVAFLRTLRARLMKLKAQESE